MKVREIGPELLRGMLASGLSVEIQARGVSMFPTLIPRQRLLVVPVSEERPLKRGDIIAFVLGGNVLVAHRLVRIGRDAFVTRGDSVSESDSPICQGQVLGRVAKASMFGRMVRVDGALSMCWGRLQMATWPVSSRLNHMMAIVAYRVVKFLKIR